MYKFSDDFFKEEDISGFHVTEMMKRYWASNIECLGEVDRICKKYDISYCLSYGSLLGAVRHGGYIPWDDDLDIMMLRHDYKKFLEVYEKEMNAPFYAIHTDDTCIYPMSIHNSQYMQIADEFLEKFHGCPYMSGVDIFVLDNLPTDALERDSFLQFYRVVFYVAQRMDLRWNVDFLPEIVHSAVDNPSEEDLEEVISGIEEYAGCKFVRDESLPRQMVDYCHSLQGKYGDDCEYVTDLSIKNWPDGGDGCMEKALFEDLIDMDFNGIKFPVPRRYKEVLTVLYGEDYMTPIMNAASHDYPTYKKQAIQLKKIFDECNATPPDYFYL